jgi:hypothetical protein
MTTSVRRLTVLVLAAGVALAVGAEPPAPRTAPDKAAGRPAPSYRFSGPYTHDNLSIFLIHGDDAIKGKSFLTLDEALQQKKVVVHETKNVNQLAIENVSGDEVFVQAGDIVKGGQQDRTIAVDMVVPPKSGKVPLGAFCVEAGRWTARGKEAAAHFAACTDQLNSNSLKLAARQAGSQAAVWENVSKAQMDLKKNVKAEVQAAESKSSLQLTLEHKKVVEAVEAYVKKLAGSPEGKNDVIGYAVVINGKVNNADVYGNAALFKKLWPKLLKASAVEAVAAKNDKKFEPATTDAVRAFLAEAEKGKKSEKAVNDRLRQLQQESARNFLFETADKDRQGAYLRRSYIAK